MIIPPYDIDAFRRDIPILTRAVPLNNCSQAPQLATIRRAALEYLDSWNEQGMDWDAWMEEVERCRASFARLICASADEVAICSSVSEAAASVASALDFSNDRNRIVLSETEFPGVAHVWAAQERRGAHLDWIPIAHEQVDAGEFERRIDSRTALVSACHAWYQNGFIQDIPLIARAAHEAGALIFVDAYQTAGVAPIDVKAMDVDFLASGALKYLFGVPGIAFLYVRRELIDRLEPMLTGWFGRRNPFAFDAKTLDWAPTARRFDTGTPPVFNAYVSRAGIDTINRIGADTIREWTAILGKRLIERGLKAGLTLHGTPHIDQKTPSTAWRCEDAHAAESAMREKGFITSARGPVLRLAPHFYNTLDEMEDAIEALAEVL